jgi:hypothetical protein
MLVLAIGAAPNLFKGKSQKKDQAQIDEEEAMEAWKSHLQKNKSIALCI